MGCALCRLTFEDKIPWRGHQKVLKKALEVSAVTKEDTENRVSQPLVYLHKKVDFIGIFAVLVALFNRQMFFG